MIGTARLERGEPAAEAGEFIRRQLRNSFGDFFDFHVSQYSTAPSLREAPGHSQNQIASSGLFSFPSVTFFFREARDQCREPIVFAGCNAFFKRRLEFSRR